ncbi:DNA primase [Mucilaginibacter conchicola]|uniref:DNA primase n=1 Tax=Mucilaginibacter conchicola TaxID=2303333 RepID=A0A372NUL2_9SPHI|nr:CHC2 zinc finger domain-containing protein [Mucilaginibacter conchicola]RFZ92938.1 DNA primase [Mucilaginibacter conchicola]
MDFSDEYFSLAKVKDIDLNLFLGVEGFEPVARKKNDTDWWYLSPLRNEKTASFHVDLLRNEWYDFGLGAGGNPLDFFLRYYTGDIPEVLEILNHNYSTHTLQLYQPERFADLVSEAHKLLVTAIRPLYSYPLKNYLHERSVPVSVADQFCRELTYEIGGRSYYGIGFQNDAGGWEIRNKNFKQSSAPKDITCLAHGAGSVHVFEGFMDFLSWRSLNPYVDPHSVDTVVLNGAGLFDRALPFLNAHERVHLWLDRDVTGLAFRDYALSRSSRFVDESGLYERFKDLNEWLQRKGETPLLRRQSGLHLT